MDEISTPLSHTASAIGGVIAQPLSSTHPLPPKTPNSSQLTGYLFPKEARFRALL